MLGDKALWKNAQNIAKKKKASETINNPIPIFKPLCTANVWFPRYVASDIMSLNHKDIDNIKQNKARYIKNCANIKLLKVNTALKVKFNKHMLVFKGQGDGETKWKGWDWNKLLVKLVIKIKELKFILWSKKKIFFFYILYSN